MTFMIKKNVLSLIVVMCTYFIFISNSFTKEQLSKEELNKLIYEYIMENPEVILDSVDKLRKKMEENAGLDESYLKENFLQFANNPNIPYMGSEKPKVIIIEFFDYNCGYCKRNFTELMELILEDKEVKIILKEFPILGESSLLASKAAIASKKQGKYFEMHQKLLSQKNRIDLGKIKEVANEIGINVGMLIQDMEKESNLKIIQENKILAEKIGIDGTPTFIIGQEVIPGSIGKEDFINSLANL